MEDDAELLEYRCSQTRLPLWPLIRIAFIRMVMSDLLYGTVVTGASTARISILNAMTSMGGFVALNCWFGLTQRSDAAVCFFADAVANQRIDGKWFNRLSDHFALNSPIRTLTFEDHFEWIWPLPRHNRRVRFHAPQQAINALLGRLNVRDEHRNQAAKLVDMVCRRAWQSFAWEPGVERRAKLTEMLARKAAALPAQYRAYGSLFTRIRPKVVMVLAGCYGPASSLIAAARQFGAVTAEYQHGAVSMGHDAYNFAPAVRKSDVYRGVLPDYFLSYGAWWNDQINVPIHKTAIGNPHRETRVAALRKKSLTKNRVLILSDGVEFPIYLALAKEIQKGVASKGLKVVIRPHPLERARVMSQFSTEVAPVAFDEDADLYTSLSSAHMVVSEVSTALFEAVGLVDRIFMWDTRKSRFAYPQHPLQAFSSANHLLELLKSDDSAGRVALNTADAIWAEPWHENYIGFLRARKIIPPYGS